MLLWNSHLHYEIVDTCGMLNVSAVLFHYVSQGLKVEIAGQNYKHLVPNSKADAEKGPYGRNAREKGVPSRKASTSAFQLGHIAGYFRIFMKVFKFYNATKLSGKQSCTGIWLTTMAQVCWH